MSAKNLLNKVDNFIYEKEKQANKGYVHEDESSFKQNHAYKYGIDVGRKSTSDKFIKEHKIQSLINDDENMVSTVFGVRKYDPSVKDALSDYEADRLDIDFDQWIDENYNKADPIKQQWLQKKYPFFFERRLNKFNENFEAYIFDMNARMWPYSGDNIQEKILYLFLLEKGLEPPSVDFFNLVTSSEEAKEYNLESGYNGTKRTLPTEALQGITFIDLFPDVEFLKKKNFLAYYKARNAFQVTKDLFQTITKRNSLSNKPPIVLNIEGKTTGN